MRGEIRKKKDETIVRTRAVEGSKRSETAKRRKYIRKNTGENKVPVENMIKKTIKVMSERSIAGLFLDQLGIFLMRMEKAK